MAIDIIKNKPQPNPEVNNNNNANDNRYNISKYTDKNNNNSLNPVLNNNSISEQQFL